ncbi:MAG: ribosome maturation factor RimM [Chloroflexota bacterium]|nr:ribosome maturation factor RimM [Chloroflexota bacterium]MDE2895605.1 ribosome maturation factor RimM [Chloroflexota bacterium]
MAFRLGRSQTEERMPRAGYRAVGLVERPRGLKGEIKVLPLTDFPQRFDRGARVFIDGAPRTVESSNWQKGRVYLFIDGVADLESAESLRGELIEIPEEERPSEGESFWYLDEIEGLRVVGGDGAELGTIREVLQTGANDVYIVDRGERRDLLVPALRDVVVDVDLGAGTMTVDLPDGLLPADEAVD